MSKIEKGSWVRLKTKPGSNLIDWDSGKVNKLNMDEDEALIQINKDGRTRIFWEFVSNIELIDPKDYSIFTEEQLVCHLATENTVQYNLLKAVEETTEYNEAVVKYFTKHKSNPKRPTLEEIFGEYADMIIRGQILALQIAKIENPEADILLLKESMDELVMKSISIKFDKFRNYLSAGNYKKGV